MKLAIVGAGLLAAGAAAVLLGVLPPSHLVVIADEVWPILVFVVAITIVAELAALAGVFDVVAHALAGLSRGSTRALWMLVVLLAIVTTAFLSLDTTAVLLTPVVISMTRARGIDPVPFVFTTVWLAGTASLVLPVSNLTNLLASRSIGDGSVGAFLATLGPSAAVSIAVSTVLLFLLHRRALTGRHPVSTAPIVDDQLRMRASLVVLVILLPLLASGLPPWISAVGAAVILLVIFVWRSPRLLTPALVPWSLILFAAGLFVAVAAVEELGSRALLTALAGTGGSPVDLFRLAGSGMLTANLGNNLPAFLALESLADTDPRMAALLIGVNTGSLILPWASLATLLWHSRVVAAGVEVSWRRFILFGLVATPLTVGCAVVPLLFRG